MATQNPIESEGTYPLPEAQVDRFMMKVVVGYPTPGEEAVVVERSLRPAPVVRSILTADGLAELQALTADVYVDRAIVDYAVALTAATREPGQGRAAERQGVHRLRREPARVDQPDPRRPGPGPRPRPPLRHPVGCHRAGPRRAPPSDRAELRGARRGSHGRHDPRPPAAGRARSRSSPPPIRRSRRSGAHDAWPPSPGRVRPRSPGRAPRPRRSCARST